MNLKTIGATALLLLAVAACSATGATPVPATSAGASSSSAPASGSGAPSGTPTPITVKDFTLDPKDITVTGQASLGVTNAGPTIHNVTIRDASGKVVAATKDLRPGQSEVLAFDLHPLEVLGFAADVGGVALDSLVERAGGAGRVGREHALERALHVGRVEGRAVVERHAPAEVKHVAKAVVADRPPLGEIGLEALSRRRELDQLRVDELLDGVREGFVSEALR